VEETLLVWCFGLDAIIYDYVTLEKLTTAYLQQYFLKKGFWTEKRPLHEFLHITDTLGILSFEGNSVAFKSSELAAKYMFIRFDAFDNRRKIMPPVVMSLSVPPLNHHSRKRKDPKRKAPKRKSRRWNPSFQPRRRGSI